MGLTIRLLGGFELRDGDRVVLDEAWRPAKAAAIVKILALQPGRSLHRDQLIDLLWPEADAEAGGSSFYKNVHHLRVAVRKAGALDPLVLKRGLVLLAPDAEVDVAAFRERGASALAGRDIAGLEGALAVCGGDLLPGDLYEEWTQPHREEIRGLRQRLQLSLGERYLQRQRFDDAIRQYQAVLAADYLAEDAHRGLMQAYGASGQRDLALQQYERCRDILEAELDAKPSVETDALAQELRRVDRLRSPVEMAIEEPLRAGDAASRRRDWEEAVDQYRQAIDRLHETAGDDEREAELLLKLATATSALSASPEIADLRRRAADLAERAGGFELMARALTQFQDAASNLPNNHAGQREAAELIEAALARCPEDSHVSRALLLAASARPLAAGARTDNEQHVTGRLSVAGIRDPRLEERLQGAVAAARQSGRPEILSYALIRLRTFITSPDTLELRLELTEEGLALVENTSHELAEYEARLFRHEDLLEVGDVDGARIQARAMLRLGERMRAEGVEVVAKSLLATHAIADGPLQEGKRLLFESRALDEKLGNTSNSQFRFGIQLLSLRWHEGRIGELYSGYRRTVDVFPRMDAARAALALICAESGRLDEARVELNHLCERPVAAIPRDYMWWQTVVCMACAAIATRSTSVAVALYDAVSQYADRNASIAGAVSLGSAQLVLARLAALLERGDEAVGHFERALAFNIRTRQQVWVSRTRFHYAEMLLARGHGSDGERAAELLRIARDDAREAGMAYETMEHPVA